MMDNNLVSENNRLRKELKANQTAYAKLNNEKDEAIKALKQANEKIANLESLLKLKEQLLIEVREEKEKEVAELVKIKNDLEMRLQSALEDGIFELENSTQPDQPFSQGGWGQYAGHSQLTCAKAIETLNKWEGVTEITEELSSLMKKGENENISWKPGTPLHLKWKPHVKVYVSNDNQSNDVLEALQNELFPQLELYCKNGGMTISFISLITEHLDEFSLADELAVDISLDEIKSSDLFLGIIGDKVTNTTKSEVEHGFLNNPSLRPSVFLFIDGQKSITGNKLKQRIRGSSSYTTIIECNQISDDVCNDLHVATTNVLKTSYDIFEPPNGNQEATFSRLSLLADMRIEYEQKDILNNILKDVPQNPVCIELTFENLKAYMAEKTTVAPYLITAPMGSGKSLLLAKWIETLERDYRDEVSVLYHFVSHSCSSSSDSCLMYRRFCHKLLLVPVQLVNDYNTISNSASLYKYESECVQPSPSTNILMLLYDTELSGASLAVDPDTQDDVFSDWLNKTAAALEQSAIIFFVIDNAELLHDYSQLSWLHKPLPKNVRVILTVNEASQYPDSWKHLASCTLPTPTSTDLQQILPNILYGNKKKSLTEDQTISLVIVSQYSYLWCVLATRFILSISGKLSDSEIDDEVLPALEDATEISELVKIILDEFESTHPSLTIAIEQIIQLIYCSRNGLLLSELQQLLQFPDIIVCLIINELKNRCVLTEIAGILQFTHESVLEVVQFKYHLESLPEDLLIWPETLICFFSRLQSQLLSRCTEELPWLLKRGELQQDLANVLLNIDILIQLYCSGQGSLLLKYWRWIGTIKDSIPEQYKVELGAVEEQAGEDESSLLYVAMVMLTVGKILRNLGLIDETQPLLQRALELYESHCDPDSENIANALSELAYLYILMKKYSAAECYYNQALEIYEHIYGECSDEAIHILEALKKLYQETKKSELLDGIGTRLISLREQRKKSKATAHTTIIKCLSTLETQLNRFENEQVQDAEYIKCLNQWSVLHAAFGQPNSTASADESFYSALSISEAVLGSEHPQTVCILKNYTKLHRKLEKFSDAITLQWRIVEIKEKLGENNDINFANTLSDLADLHYLNSNHNKAVAIYDRAIELYVLHYGHDHPKVQESMEKRELAS